MTPPKVSALFTVFNKAGYLARTIASVRSQMPDEAQIEYVFADDLSSDHSLDIVRTGIKGAPHMHIIENSENRGPSVRLNQAARVAEGEYLYFLDSDDLAAPGTIPAMLDMLEREKADFIYGRTEKRVLGPGEEPPAIDPDAPYTVSDMPLKTVLGGGFVRMALMCRRDVFLEAGGADERIFIQDESLPLRLAMTARRLIDWQAKIVYRQPDPAGDGSHISSNRDQLQHDAFLAASHALNDLPDALSNYAPKLYARAVSQHWKMRKRHGALPLVSRDFWRYHLTRRGAQPNAAALAKMRADFQSLKNVRRMD